MAKLKMTVNGKAVGPHDVPDDLPMVVYLNDILGLTGTKFSCGIGVCRACVVMVEEPDGSITTRRTCIAGATSFADSKVTTVEGHATHGQLSAVQQAYVDNFAFQCGYCTSGFVNAGTALVEQLRENPVDKSQVEQAVQTGLGDHICRCSGYVRYFEAMRDLILSDTTLTKEG
ncbi:2Fe-2S iron-sulfur cluster-binding protein [uncultured Ruegeria sp.]|uniref:(2Fe-2S)-binding protein n=1 Tax=uncultured Ruegeria sp. TaxID=259304 RepID=UPI00262FC841|nr:2Fe-2S iron-sulfur cluster-binding protein [uncultured Ruegeria sp.]